MDHKIPSMDRAIPASTSHSEPAESELRVFDEAAHDAARGLRDSAALAAAKEQLHRLWAAVRPSPPRSVGPLAVAVFMPFIVLLWSITGGWVVGAFVAAFLAVSEIHRHKNLRWHRRCRTGSCRACDYPLGGLRDAIAPELLGGLRIGPRVCPECGTRWPRLPPE